MAALERLADLGMKCQTRRNHSPCFRKLAKKVGVIVCCAVQMYDTIDMYDTTKGENCMDLTEPCQHIRKSTEALQACDRREGCVYAHAHAVILVCRLLEDLLTNLEKAIRANVAESDLRGSSEHEKVWDDLGHLLGCCEDWIEAHGWDASAF